MATFPQNPISGSPLIGSPVIIAVQPMAHDVRWTFHRIVLRVMAALVVPDGTDGGQLSDTDYTTLSFTTPVDYTTDASGAVTATKAAQFDISSALQAVASRYEYQYAPPSQYPYIKFRVMAWDEYMLDGDTYDTWDDAALLPGIHAATRQYYYYYALQGAFSDMERIMSGGSRELSRFTRKPLTTPEVVFRGSQVLMPATLGDPAGLDCDYADPTTGDFVDAHPTGYPRTVVYTPTLTGANTLGDRTVYAIAKPKDGFEIRFVNGLGCLESIHVRSLRTVSVDIEVEQHAVSRFETFSKFSRGLAVKQAGHEKWQMTSGPQDEAWASWYLHEFLQTQTCWLQVGTVWVPCHVLPDETVTLVNRQKADLMEVQFTLQLDITGSPMSALQV